MTDQILTSACQCGEVECQGIGRPILCGVCYCDDCQAGAASIEALDGAPKTTLPDGGTHYLTFRDDRFACIKGAELLTAIRRDPNSSTRRMIATCCNSAMFLKFERGHWISTYAARFQGELPPIEMRTQTRYRSSTLSLPDDAPAYRGFGPRLFAKLIAARIAMLWG